MPVVNQLPSGEGKTLLWQNPNPGRNFGLQTITTLANIYDFEKFRVTWRMGVEDDGKLIDVDYMPANMTLIEGGEFSFGLSMAIRGVNDTTYERRMAVDGTNRIWIGDCLRANASGISNNLIIPMFIYGIK